MTLYDWQLPHAERLRAALLDYNVAADGSDTGVGKMYIACHVAKSMGRDLFVLCPKAIVPEWERVAQLFGVPCTAVNYERIRTGKTPHGHWDPHKKAFTWTLHPGRLLVFDEAHACGGMLVKGKATMNARMLIAARRQNLMVLLSSATLIANPLKAYAIGYVLGLHQIGNFWKWATKHEVRKGYFGMEWSPSKARAEVIMGNIRAEIGPKFQRIRKADVPGFPENQVIPTLVSSVNRPDLIGEYGVDARMAVELEKVPAIVDLAEDLVGEGHSVVIFINFRATLAALQEKFPKADSIHGAQHHDDRQRAINSFQQNATNKHVLLVMAQAGGTGLSLHDTQGRPRAALICPGYNATEFLQVLGRIHRAGSLSPAVNYVLCAEGVPVERRIRDRLEAKLNNLASLNDHDLAGIDLPTGGADANPVPAHADQCDGGGSPESVLPSGDPHNPHGSGSPGPGVGAAGGAGVGGVGPGAGAGQLIMTTQPAHTERKHARCSPSKLKNLSICPSYRPEVREEVHPVTLRGTIMHEALETGNDSALLPEEVPLVQMCRDFVAEELATCEKVVDEVHLKTHDPDVQGFVDRLILFPRNAAGRRKASIRDYKMGFNLVDGPDVNLQAISYVVGTFLKYEDVDEVDFAFLLPRLDVVLQHTFKRSDLPELKLLLSTVANRVREQDGKVFSPDADNCLYCGRKADCPALGAKMLQVVKGYNEDNLPLPTQAHSSQITSPEEMARALNAATIAEKWADSVRAHALAMRVELGQEIPGYTLVERQGKRTITNPVVAWTVAQGFGVTQEEFLAAATLSVPSLEDAVKSKVEKGKAKRAQEFTDTLSDLNAITRGAPYLVLQKDKKKAALNG